MTSSYFHKPELNLFSLTEQIFCSSSRLHVPSSSSTGVPGVQGGNASLGRTWLRRTAGARLAHEPQFHREQGGVFKTISLG